MEFITTAPSQNKIYYLNKPTEASGFGHAGVLIPGTEGAYTYYSYYASRKFVPFCAGTLLMKEFSDAAAALAYAKLEGYSREAHWMMDLSRTEAARAALTGDFATGTRWRLISRNCWDAVYAALKAAGADAINSSRRPNRNFEKNKSTAEGWSYL
jgi:hypothetical protein